jgi:glutathione reductase (NADPH)
MTRGDQMLRSYDEALRERLLHISMLKGIDFRFNAEFEGIEKMKDGCLRVSMTNHEPIEVDCVMFATGRVPNTEGRRPVSNWATRARSRSTGSARPTSTISMRWAT